MTSIKELRMELLLNACKVGSFLYPAAAAALCYIRKNDDEKDEDTWESRRVDMAQTHLLASAGAGVALLGAAGFQQMPFAPIWLPTMLTSSSLMCYIHLNWDNLLTKKNNRNLNRNIGIAASLALFGGWTAGPLVTVFGSVAKKTFVPFSMAALMGSATACYISPHPASLLVHAPLASISYAGVFLNVAHGGRVAASYAKVIIYSLGSSLLANVYTAYCQVFNKEIDIVTHSLGLMTGGAVAFYKVMRESLKLKTRLVVKVLKGAKDDPHDERAMASFTTMVMIGLYYYTIVKARKTAVEPHC